MVSCTAAASANFLGPRTVHALASRMLSQQQQQCTTHLPPLITLCPRHLLPGCSACTPHRYELYFGLATLTHGASAADLWVPGLTAGFREC